MLNKTSVKIQFTTLETLFFLLGRVYIVTNICKEEQIFQEAFFEIVSPDTF